MSDAPTPPAQTPVTFVRAGAGDYFSAECQAALLKANYNPSWFGSYNHTARLLKKAREKCDKFDTRMNPGKDPNAPKPTAQDRYLASCWAGHLTQDAVYRKSGGRGDPCENWPSANGYSVTQAPCMPMAGDPADPRTEHGLASKHEQDSAGSQGTANQPYTADKIAEHSDDRAKKLAGDQASANLAKRDSTDPESEKGKEGKSAGGGAKSGGTAGETIGADAGKPSQPNEPASKESTAEKAAECINAFRKAYEERMRQKCRNEAGNNRARANGGKDVSEEDGKKYRAGLHADAKKAEEDLKKDPENKDKQNAAEQAKGRATRAERAKCRADQGDALKKSGPPPGPEWDGAVPRNASPPQTGGTGATDGSM
ncbi:MAG TPA: hypothetical protein VGG91_18670 [Myxococcaceae bacterium]|jgi:hypothetical protein